MYISIDDGDATVAYVEKLKERSAECATYRIGLSAAMVFFHNLGSEGGYVILTQELRGGEITSTVEITDETEVMKVIANRVSQGSRELSDNQLTKILKIIEPFRPPV